jgi:hypothetical protein
MELRGRQLDELEHELAAAIEQALRAFVAKHTRLAGALPEGGDGHMHHLMAKAAAAVLEGHLAGR